MGSKSFSKLSRFTVTEVKLYFKMEFKVYLFVFTLILIFTQSISAPSGNKVGSIDTTTKKLEPPQPTKPSYGRHSGLDSLGGGYLL